MVPPEVSQKVTNFINFLQISKIHERKKKMIQMNEACQQAAETEKLHCGPILA